MKFFDNWLFSIIADAENEDKEKVESLVLFKGTVHGMFKIVQ